MYYITINYVNMYGFAKNKIIRNNKAVVRVPQRREAGKILLPEGCYGNSSQHNGRRVKPPGGGGILAHNCLHFG
jgi:hypothetical protein